MSEQLLLIQAAEASYFKQRMDMLGILPEHNTIDIWHGTSYDSVHKGDNALLPLPIFRETEKGIDIFVYTLDRKRIRITTTLKRKSGDVEATVKDYCVTRLETPIVKKDGDIIKYLMPKGYSTQPFFPPGLVRHYDKCVKWKKENPGQKLPARLAIKALYMTEGYFKSFKADMHGINCVGIASITCMKNKETGALHDDIQKLLITCEVERFIWLMDGDCRNITSKEITDGKDLYQRPWGFYKTIYAFSDLLSKHDDLRKYFAHINTTEIEGHPKGLDDLLCARPDELADIAAEFNEFSKKEIKGIFEGNYLYRRDITFGMNQVKKYFMLSDVDEFYNYHVQYRKELETCAFKYDGSMYRFNAEQTKCIVEIPGAAERYFRVGDEYNEWIKRPNKFGELVLTYKNRQKTTIIDDHNKGIIKHIVKYHDYCVVPEHINYRPIIGNCFNRYVQLPHEPEQGDYSTSMEFVKHIFGDNIVTVNNGDGDTRQVPYYELGLDYLTILYKYPQQVLPILCLVSKENNTGKSTFLDWLNYIFSENMIQVGNEELKNPFNDFWSSKLIVACDETKVDKQEVFEKIKRNSTGETNISQGKGKKHEVVDNFVKFIFCSNNEDSFVNISHRDTRFWVLKVKPFEKVNVFMRNELREEIDAFLYFLNTRQLVTKNMTRSWFDYGLMRTEALQRLIENTKPSMERRIRQEIQELFDMQPDKEEFTIPLEALCTDILKKAEKNYVRRTLNDMDLNVGSPGRGFYPRRVEVSAGIVGQSAYKECQIEYVAFHNRYYTFLRKDFTDSQALPPAVGEENKTDLPF